jgi:small multidrug resistance family-3 protein
MTKLFYLAILLVAAVLEAGGDALVRHGINGGSWITRGIFFMLGAVVLFAYGLTVNAPAWDFGRLLGIYVTLFFVVAQAINWIVFGQAPGLPILIGGLLIISGGLTITFWRQ